MFPRLKQRLGSVVLDRMDLLVELSTLGEYGLAEDGLPVRIGQDFCSERPSRAGSVSSIRSGGRPRDVCSLRGSSTPGRCDQQARS